ncbi:MAG: hypothetical protein Q9160_000323 [Pyrenula sp. 1 TL-2023]
MPEADEESKKRVSRKLSKRPRQMFRLPSSQIPERLRESNDAQEDVAAPAQDSNGRQQYMNQSIFSMVAAAGSKTDFHSRFDESSDSEGEDQAGTSALRPDLTFEDQKAVSQVVESSSQNEEDNKNKHSDNKSRKHKRKKSENRLLQSLPKLHLRSSKKNGQAASTDVKRSFSSVKPTITSPEDVAPSEAPFMTRMAEAKAYFEASGSDVLKESESSANRTRQDSSSRTLLEIRLMEIFGFDRPEKVVSEYACWLMQSVLLQGYMYITGKHICFYAYLPKKSSSPSKSGYLSKRGRQNPKYRRYWFSLKGDILSYFTSPADKYFLAGNIDLRYGISAALTDSSKDAKDFTVVTDHRSYYFRADSSASAKEWVKHLQKVIFRSHNDGDSVKISLPIENIVDVEESPVIEFAETVMVRVIENDDSYAIDEYYFSFFSFGNDALRRLQALVDDTPARRLSQDLLSPLENDIDVRKSRSPSPRLRESLEVGSPNAHTSSNPLLRDTVRATLVPRSPGLNSGRSSPRPSGEWGRSSRDMIRGEAEANSQIYGRASFDRGRRSGSTSRFEASKLRQSTKSPPSKHQDSSDSYVQSMEPGTESSLNIDSATDTQNSPSQILNRSDVFRSPTIERLRASPSTSNHDVRRHSEDTTRSAPKADIKVHPPSRAHTKADMIPVHSPLLKKSPATSTAGDSEKIGRTSSSTALQDLVKAGSYPLRRASGLPSYVKNRSKRISNLLATESMSYFEKVSGMWAGGRRHYSENEDVLPDDEWGDAEDTEAGGGHGDRFRAHFALPSTERLQATYFCYIHRVLPLYGKIYISHRKLCFRSLLPGTKTKLVLPIKDIENVHKESGFSFRYHGLVLVVRGHEEIFFEFSSADSRNDCAVTLHQNIESVKYLVESGLLGQEEQEEADVARAEHELLQEARKDGQVMHDLELPSTISSSVLPTRSESPTIFFDDTRASIINFKPTESLRITCLTIGSRGDVQPYIALCKGFLEEGHRPKIATHTEFEPWVRKHGIDFQPVDGDPAELMKICVENGMFTYSFLKEASSKFRDWIDDLLASAWKACQDSDILIESPSAMAGIHIAEALRIPYFRAFTMPWTRTRAYPHAFAVPSNKIGGAYNYFTYIMFDAVFWKAIAGQVNRWRKKELGLGSTTLEKMQVNKIPFLYNFSPHVVVPPLDYSDWVRVTGYWFLDEGTQDWSPPEELKTFINRARSDGKKLVYIGFGSIVVSDPAALTKTVVDSVLKADVRCILSKGWSERLGDPKAAKPETPMPPEILQIKSVPHDWLFTQIDAAAHHGGAGTTGASLRAGLPTIIKPFFGDQFFFGGRVEDLGVGICLRKVNVSVFARALWEAVHSERMITKAKVLGEQIRKEDGVATAIQAIYRDLEYARTLINVRHQYSTTANPHIATAGDDDMAAIEETWTFIGDENDPELRRRIKDHDISGRTSTSQSRSQSRRTSRGRKAVEAVEPVPATIAVGAYGQRLKGLGVSGASS